MFTGDNQELKWKLLRSLYRFKEGKALSLEEETIYGADGLLIKIDNQVLKVKQVLFLFMTEFQDINEQFSLNKNTLMFHYLMGQLNMFHIQKQYEQLIDQLLLFEEEINTVVNDISSRQLSFNLADVCLEGLIKKGTINGKEKQPLSLLDYHCLIDGYLNLLEYYLKYNNQYVFLVMRHEETFLDAKQQRFLYTTLRQLTYQYPTLVVLKIYDAGSLNNILVGETEEIIFLGKNIQQLPPLDVIHKTVFLHYPTECHLSEQELYHQLCYLLPLINNEFNHSQFEIDMILFEVIQKLLK